MDEVAGLSGKARRRSAAGHRLSNAGVTTQQTDFASLTDEQYFRILNINVNGVVFGVREAVRAMTPDGGSILATASLAGLIAYAGDPIYALTKHAVVGLVRGLGQTLPDRGITLNAICPGITETPRFERCGTHARS